MLRTSFRFYLFSILIVLNTCNFIGDFIFMDFSIFVIMRSSIIILAVTIFQVTIIFMIRTSSENLDHNKSIRSIICVEYVMAFLSTGFFIYLFIDILIKVIETQERLKEEYKKEKTFAYIDVDKMLIKVNKMYFAVCVAMFIEILFFLIFIRILYKAIRKEELIQKSNHEYKPEHFVAVRKIFSNLVFVLVYYSCMVIFELVYNAITWFTSN